MNPVSSESSGYSNYANAHPGAEDGRRFARKPCKLAARLTILESLDARLAATRDFDVVVRNISRTGVCVLFVSQLYPDDFVQLTFDGGIVRRYRVARCRRIAANRYEMGLSTHPQKMIAE